MKVLPIEGAGMTVLELAELAKSEAVILTRAGQPLIAIRDISGSDWESASLASSPRFQEIIEQSRRSYAESGGIGIDELRRELGLEPSQGGGSPEP